MLFTLFCLDRPGQSALRAATREAHLAFLAGHGGAVLHGGPLLDQDGGPVGSLLVVEQPDRDAAERFVADDPYARAGLFDSVRIDGHRLVFRNGERVG